MLNLWPANGVTPIDFALSPDQEAVRDAIAKICARFDEDYWLKRDREGGFPHDFHQALAAGGWLGIAAERARNVAETTDLLGTALADGGPMLIDVTLDRAFKPV